jgi:hypothetical protein
MKGLYKIHAEFSSSGESQNPSNSAKAKFSFAFVACRQRRRKPCNDCVPTVSTVFRVMASKAGRYTLGLLCSLEASPQTPKIDA